MDDVTRRSFPCLIPVKWRIQLVGTIVLATFGIMGMATAADTPAVDMAATPNVVKDISVAVSDVALVLDSPPAKPRLPETDTVYEIARRITKKTITVLVPIGDGTFAAEDGSVVSLDRFRVLWIHQGDTISQTGPLFETATVDALKQAAKRGTGFLLSGGAAALLTPLTGVSTSLTPMTFGDDRAQAGIEPVAESVTHPLFHEMTYELRMGYTTGMLWFSNALYPGFSSLIPDPQRTTQIGKSAGETTMPLVEYDLVAEANTAGDTADADATAKAADVPNGGNSLSGKILVFGWRFSPHYDAAAPSFRANTETFFRNALQYLDASLRPALERCKSQETAASWWERRQRELCTAPLRRAIEAMRTKFAAEYYPRGDEFLARLEKIEAAPVFPKEEFESLKREALLANPLLDFTKILVVKRAEKNLGLPQNFYSNSVLETHGYDNEIAVLSWRDGTLKTLYRPEDGTFVGDVDLDFDASRILFSQPDANRRWRIREMTMDRVSADPESVTAADAAADTEKRVQPKVFPLTNDAMVDCYDGCYLPDGRVIFCSTACFTGVPCVNGAGDVCNLYLWDPRNTSMPIRQLTFEQDHDWCPTVKPDGRILYQRWEYTDLPHAFSRILFHMNPDGTNQSEYYGSGSYWPGSMFYARPVPPIPPQFRNKAEPSQEDSTDSSMFVGIVGGHHELPRMGDLVLFDPSTSRRGTEGAVQRIPGYGKPVESQILDLPIAHTWPKFLHPYPLSEDFYLVSMKLDEASPWGIYLVDRFDNLLCLYQEPGYAIFEPIPLRATERPPVLVDRVDMTKPEAEVFIADIYAGEGLQGVPRGTVKSLRVISYQFAYQEMGAEPYSVGLDGPWDPKVVIGTVPVLPDGSVSFKIPAYVPVAFQPLDADGRAIQRMRSWVTAMPGEVVSCVGCHESQNSVPPSTLRPLAATVQAVNLTPFPGVESRRYYEADAARQPTETLPNYTYGDPECRGGFNFRRELQPVLDRYCVGCHGKGETAAKPCLTDEEPRPTLDNQNGYNLASVFSPSYYALRRFVRTQTKESQMPTHLPWEFHAGTTQLVQLLENDHYGVRLDPESWTRLNTWIDLNAPYHGSWWDIRGDGAPNAIPDVVRQQESLRREMRRRYTGLNTSVENPAGRLFPTLVYRAANDAETSSERPSTTMVSKTESADAATVETSPVATNVPETNIPETESIALSPEVSLELVRIPGQNYLIGRYEITNEQYAMFDPSHTSGIEYGDYIQFSPGEMGWPLGRAQQPVVRISWEDANQFCEWLSAQTGRRFSLPTNTAWLAAAGDGVEGDSAARANLADERYAAIDPFGWTGRPEVLPAWRPANSTDDRNRVSAPVGTYAPNQYGIYDMVGNVAEWMGDTPDAVETVGKKIVRGGSWADLPERAAPKNYRAYLPYQPVFDVGFRVMCEP
ncbi:MAG: SUMF1/EgtB/PvdO family nonheme iron enzyme [Thermoguttaceae bacterium]|nr:SUMF1/EgtB/PvdO family nonheme iron enzyme [Thermoguttaceae bacterium]